MRKSVFVVAAKHSLGAIGINWTVSFAQEEKLVVKWVTQIVVFVDFVPFFWRINLREDFSA
ncbi:MAG: hypothetical protein OEV93_04740 [Candidatus Moranbacteria bacterium]|nr:hypothetical protein [Candidatus Moranbacteria bacterium]